MKKSYSKYIILFSTLIAAAFIMCWGANVLLLSKFYLSKMENNLKRVYEHLNTITDENGLESDEFLQAFVSDTETFNCDILLLDQNMEIVASNGADTKEMLFRLLDYLFKDENADYHQRVIESTENYIMVITPEGKGQSEYVELCGTLNAGNPILIRAAVSGMHENARLANIFSAYVGIVAILVSFILVAFIAKNLTLSNELRKRTEMDEMRKEFISNVSHELKTPIAIIQGYAEGLADCVNDDEESRSFYCEVITDEAQKMNRIVKNLLDLNELEFGNTQISKESFNITELIKNCLHSVEIMTKQNGINVEYDDSNEVIVYSDEFSVERVLNNYLSNAIHYASGDKIIKVSVSQKDKNDRVRISVFNTGDRIPDESIDKLWTKFYKVDKARTREYGGSGVGLSIVKAIMESLGEKYGVRNLDDGVEFWFEAECKKV